VNFTINLNTDITSVGESKASGGVIVVRIATGNAATSFTAVQQACTHAGTSVNYNVNQDKFICLNHGSTFTDLQLPSAQFVSMVIMSAHRFGRKLSEIR